MLVLMHGPAVNNRRVLVRDLLPEQIRVVVDGQTGVGVRVGDAVLVGGLARGAL